MVVEAAKLALPSKSRIYHLVSLVFALSGFFSLSDILMSAPGVSGGRGGGGGAAAHPQTYYCYQCDRTVSITPSPTSDLVCPNCNGGFLEETESSLPNPSLDTFFPLPSESLPSGGFPIIFSASGGGGGNDLQSLGDLSSLFLPSFQHRSPPMAFGDPDGFNPFVFLQNYLQTLRAGGANVQFVIENNNSNSPEGFRLPANLGDYFVGPGLEQLIQQLAENDPNRYGTPPASKSAVEALPNIKVDNQLLDSDSSQCAVCKDTFEIGAEAKQMPCKHIYHSECILPWLELHNSCPVCRYELPTDDPDYEHNTQARNSAVPASPNAALGVESGGGPSRENAETPRTVERRFRISLPWPFRAFGSPAETSNSGVSTNNDGESNSGSRDNSHFGSETRQEDLD